MSLVLELGKYNGSNVETLIQREIVNLKINK